MGDSWRTWPRPGDDDLMDFTWGVDCTPGNEWCFTYREPHEHGFACDKTCRCRTEEATWRHPRPAPVVTPRAEGQP